MLDFVREYRNPLIAALLLHGLLAGLISVTVTPRARIVQPAQLAIQATVVESRTLRRLEQEREQAAAAERRRVQEQALQEQRAREEREQRAEQARQAEIARREEAERQRQAEAERQRQAAEQQRRQAEQERQRQQEAEAQRLREIERRRQAEAERRAREQAAREAELQRQLAEEEARQRAEDAGLLNQYIGMIEQRVVRNWNRPPSARPGLECEVNVSQAPTGMVLTVAIGRCNGDAAVRQSIEAAVLRSSPLPPPPDPRLFERNLKLIFRPAE